LEHKPLKKMEKRNTTVHVRVRPETKAKLRQVAARCGMSESNWVRLKLTEALGMRAEMAFPPKARRPTL
jgi:antitoxin component of RelBE/YafQ-DinJ toxin-antitoxin module